MDSGAAMRYLRDSQRSGRAALPCSSGLDVAQQVVQGGRADLGQGLCQGLACGNEVGGSPLERLLGLCTQVRTRQDMQAGPGRANKQTHRSSSTPATDGLPRWRPGRQPCCCSRLHPSRQRVPTSGGFACNLNVNGIHHLI